MLLNVTYFRNVEIIASKNFLYTGRIRRDVIIMVNFNNFSTRYQGSVHNGRANIATRYEAQAAAKAARACSGHQTETVNVKYNFGPSKAEVIGATAGAAINLVLGILGVGKSSPTSQVKDSSTVQPNTTTPSTTPATRTLQNNPTDTVPTAADVDTSTLPSGSKISNITQGTIDGSPSYVATVQNSDGSTGTYSITKDSSGKYKIGAQLAKQKGSNYVNQDKLNSAIEKEFGKGFELPDGYTAELVGDTLVVKDDKGKALNSTELTLLKSGETISKKANETSDSDDINTMLNDADSSKDGAISQDEYRTYISGLLESAGIDTQGSLKSKIDSLIDESFKNIDTKNSDGLLTKEELTQNAPKVISELTDKIGELTNSNLEDDTNNKNTAGMSADDIMYAADLDDSGKIDKTEFSDLQQSAKELGSAPPTNKSFEELDKNDDGFITKDELSQ